MTSYLKPIMGILPNFTGMIPGWSFIKVVQTVPLTFSSGERPRALWAFLFNITLHKCRTHSVPDLWFAIGRVFDVF